MGDIRSDARLLRGICSLAFEGQQFTPLDPRYALRWPGYWIEISKEQRSEVARLLGVKVGDLEYNIDSFEAEFLGTLSLAPEGAGHLNFFPGVVEIERVITAKWIKREVGPPPVGSLRERLSRMSEKP